MASTEAVKGQRRLRNQVSSLPFPNISVERETLSRPVEDVFIRASNVKVSMDCFLSFSLSIPVFDVDSPFLPDSYDEYDASELGLPHTGSPL